MGEDIRKSLGQVLNGVDGLQAIVVSDRDGVPIVKVAKESVPDMALRMNFFANFANATDHSGKLGMGRNNVSIAFYNKHQIVQFNNSSVVITLIAQSTANTGYLTTLDETLEPLIKSLHDVVMVTSD